MNTLTHNLSFKENARVVFLGDSITANGLFIAKIFDYYRTHLPERQVKMYNFGVPGDSAGGCVRMKRHELLLELAPTEIVLMFGMNDIGRTYYDDNHRNDPVSQEHAQTAKIRHTERMLEIATFLREKGLPITLCAVTPYDEISEIPSPNYIGCHGALRDIFKADTDALTPLGLKGIVDFGGEMNELLLALKAQGLPTFIGPDRVHPTELGHDLMARIFLRAQGLPLDAPSAESIADGSALLPPLSDANKKRKEAEVLWRSTAYLDFNAQWGQENMTSEERCAYWREQLKAMTDTESYLYRCAALYPERKPLEKEHFDLMLKRTDEMYAK